MTHFARSARRRSFPLAIVALLLTLLVALPGHNRAQAAEPTTTGQLVVVLVIDQARYDYLQRLRPHLSGGLGRLLAESVDFQDAHHDHAITTTAPGHATLATGRHPSSHGIIDNQWFDRATKKSIYCVEDTDAPVLIAPDDVWSKTTTASSSAGRSPANLRGTALPDWIKEQDPKSLSYAIAGKDRAAVLLGGRKADGAYWYDSGTGQLITSKYYRSVYPDWMLELNRRKLPRTWCGKLWEALAVSDELARDFGLRQFDYGMIDRSFPKAFGGLDFACGRSFYSDFGHTPMADDLLFEAATTLIAAKSLGQRGAVDYLAIGLSALDYVGHTYGPDSPEVLDTLLRLDRGLDGFLEFLDKSVGKTRTIVALGADHGVAVLPELHTESSRRLGVADVACFQRVEVRLREIRGDDTWLAAGSYLDYPTLGRNNLKRETLEADVAAILSDCPAVARVWTRTELERAAAKVQAGGRKPQGELAFFLNSFHRERSGDVLVELHPAQLDKLTWGTTHGTHHPYDTHVPLLIRAPQLRPTQVTTRVRTVDLAPTLAALLGIRPPKDVDGKDLGPLLTPRDE